MDSWTYCFECVYFDTCESIEGNYDQCGCYYGKVEEEQDGSEMLEQAMLQK